MKKQITLGTFVFFFHFLFPLHFPRPHIFFFFVSFFSFFF